MSLKTDRPLKALGILALAFVAFKLFVFFVDEPIEDKEFAAEFRAHYGVFALNRPERLDFAGESVPLNDPEVYERYDRELLVNTYWQSNGLLLLKRSRRYFPTIERILKEEGVPEDFKYLAVVESGFMPVVSPAGAAGFWQILPETAKGYGLEVNDDIDERYHLEKSTRAACQYLKEAKAKFGNWTLAAASYNMGMGGLERQVQKQKSSDYYGLYLNNETSRYVFRMLAVKQIFEEPEAYGFRLRNKDYYQPSRFRTVEVTAPVADWVSYALDQQVSYKAFKTQNPWIRNSSLTKAERTIYTVQIPLDPIEEEPEASEAEPSTNPAAPLAPMESGADVPIETDRASGSENVEKPR